MVGQDIIASETSSVLYGIDCISQIQSIRESPSQFENQIKPRVYVKHIVRKSFILLVRKISFLACEFSPIKSIFFLNLVPEKFNLQNNLFITVCFAAITLIVLTWFL